mmetsp:Transcript_25457/g.61819  ORF Transcript_25457/g.61819 Transcript_25457/m.61819 type:complete len:449 (-) Transcript_25457:108-1454(-)
MDDTAVLSGDAETSIAWLRTAEDECALDVEGFAPILPEVTKRMLDVVTAKYANQQQGLQAAFSILGDQWAKNNFPEIENDPSVLKEPFMSQRDATLILAQVRQDLLAALGDVPGQESYKQSVDGIMRTCLIKQLQNQPIQDAATLRSNVRDSIGGSLAAVWSEYPEIEARDLQRLRGMPLPQPLRAHVYYKQLGGDEVRDRYRQLLTRTMQKRGGEGDVSAQKEAVLRVVSEVIAGNKAMHKLDVPLQQIVTILVKASLVAQKHPRLERQVILLAPLCSVFRVSAQESEGASFATHVAMLLELQEQLPDLSTSHAMSLRVVKKLQSDHPHIFNVLKRPCLSYMERKSRKETLEVAMGAIVRIWLQTAFAGIFNIHSLLWAWDQMIVWGWDRLEGACLELIVIMEATWERATDWEECLTAALESPRTLTPHALRKLFAEEGRAAAAAGV